MTSVLLESEGDTRNRLTDAGLVVEPVISEGNQALSWTVRSRLGTVTVDDVSIFSFTARERAIFDVVSDGGFWERDVAASRRAVVVGGAGHVAQLVAERGFSVVEVVGTVEARDAFSVVWDRPIFFVGESDDMVFADGTVGFDVYDFFGFHPGSAYVANQFKRSASRLCDDGVMVFAIDRMEFDTDSLTEGAIESVLERGRSGDSGFESVTWRHNMGEDSVLVGILRR